MLRACTSTLWYNVQISDGELVMSAVKLNQIFEQDNVVEFIEFLRHSGSTNKVQLMIPAFREFLDDSAVKCHKLMNFIAAQGNTDLQFLLDSYEAELNKKPQVVTFYSPTDMNL